MTGVGEELHQQVRFAVGEAAGHRGTDAGRDLRVEYVGVERDMQARELPQPRQGLLGDPRQADIVPIALVSLVLALLATIYPSWRASRVNPAEALRYE